MQTPPYYHQQAANTCSLACLAMVLGWLGQDVSELTLREVVRTQYGKIPHNMLNASVARLARGLGARVTLRAELPLLQPKLADNALAYYQVHDDERQALPEAYAETLRAIEAGCVSEYGRLNRETLVRTLSNRSIIQVSVRLAKLYPERKLSGYHSILLFATDGDVVSYHDPSYGAALSVEINQLVLATSGTGPAMIYAPTNPHAH